MTIISEALEKQPVTYVTRDPERASSLLGDPNYSIITNETNEGKKLKDRYPNNVHLVEYTGNLLDTHELLLRVKTEKKLEAVRKSAILVFKNTSLIEKICKDLNLTLLNPSAALARRIEEKISQVEWLGKMAEMYPPFTIMPLAEVSFEKPFILQFNHAHTGEGTLFIQREEELEREKARFPDRMVKKSEYMEGEIITLNIVVGEKIKIGNPSYQITGLSPFTDEPFATIGNDYDLGEKTVSGAKEAFLTFTKEVEKIGEKMKSEGWRGIFGVDAIFSNERFFLIEINARQTASVTFESTLQQEERNRRNEKSLTLFEAHILALLAYPQNTPLTKISRGAQIIQRITKKIASIPKETKEKLANAEFNILVYENTERNSELIRIQSRKGIMEKHAVLNEIGRKILTMLS